MKEPIIEIKNISKKYLITHQQGGYVALRDVFAGIIKSPLEFLKKKTKEITGLEKREEFWALKDLNFEVQKGEVVGIIGSNGAGKSTLLKILSQITPPTTGEIIMRGKVGSLLEVGTGFHPELSGRENIFLNGAILGMSKKEIVEKFDDIVEFSGIGKFLDTPVKRYSSGMYVRLAFAVAAHMDPDILIIDEVLAVGDAEFQKKCLGKMDEITKTEGRTILFVSHNMEAIKKLCTRTILLKDGKIEKIGETKEVINEYLNNKSIAKNTWVNKGNEFNNEWIKISRLYTSTKDLKSLNFSIERKTDTYITIEGEIKKTDSLLTIGYALYNELEELLYWSYQTDTEKKLWPELNNGHFIIKSLIPKTILNKGIYKIKLIGGIHNEKWIFHPDEETPSISFTIEGNLSESPYWVEKRPGIVAPIIPWEKVSKY